MTTQKEKADLFLKFHHDKEILTILNTWDPGSSKLVEASGFKAIGTTSMGISASLGYPDCQKIGYPEMLEAIKRIVEKVDLPVTADVEGGYGNNTKEIVDVMRNMITTGIVGINIEDSNHMDRNLLDISEFCERITAIRELSDSIGFHLVINARTDSFLVSSDTPPDTRLAESIIRGNKYKEAGADCIFVPNVWEADKISVLVREINSPINILSNPTNGTGLPPSISELEDLGVARLSVGSSVMKSTLALVKKVADEFINSGTYDNLSDALTPINETLRAYEMATGTLKS